MKNMGIRISEKHGVNPSMDQCFFCGEVKGIALLGKMKGDREAPMMCVWSMEPCETCKGYMEKGIMLVSVREEQMPSNFMPYRTGKMCVITEDCAQKAFQPQETVDEILAKRFAFVPDTVWAIMGLPEGEEKVEEKVEEKGE